MTTGFRHRRLPGRLPTLRLVYASSRLWLGDEGLLQAETVFFTERFRRFSYADVQALTLRETARGLVYSVVCATLAAGSALLAWTNEDTDHTRFVLFGVGAFWLVLLFVNLLRGKTCRCQLQTAAGPHPLRSLSRVRLARKALRLLTEKVAAAQNLGPSA